MITFKSTEDLNKLSPDDPAYPTVKELIEQLISAYTTPGHPYDAEDYGYIILIEPEDAQRELDELWDGCTLILVYFHPFPTLGILLIGGIAFYFYRRTIA